MFDLSALQSALHALRARKERIIIALDGRCASGKTTLAALLKEETDCAVLHMDHFFLQPHQRTAERLSLPGENVDHERFLAEVLLPLKEGRPFSYRPYECHAQRFGAPIEVPVRPITVVEGSYSCHPNLWDFYDLRVFLTVDPEEQLRRILARGGEAALAAFREKWIPLEEKYFEAYKLPARCELLMNTSRSS